MKQPRKRRAKPQKETDPTGELCYGPLCGVDTPLDEGDHPDPGALKNKETGRGSGPHPGYGAAVGLPALDHEKVLPDSGELNQAQAGIVLSEDFIQEAQRLERLETLQALRASLEDASPVERPPGIEVDL